MPKYFGSLYECIDGLLKKQTGDEKVQTLFNDWETILLPRYSRRNRYGHADEVIRLLHCIFVCVLRHALVHFICLLLLCQTTSPIINFSHLSKRRCINLLNLAFFGCALPSDRIVDDQAAIPSNQPNASAGMNQHWKLRHARNHKLEHVDIEFPHYTHAEGVPYGVPPEYVDDYVGEWARGSPLSLRTLMVCQNFETVFLKEGMRFCTTPTSLWCT